MSMKQTPGKLIATLAGFGAGALAMFLLDPLSGRRRAGQSARKLHDRAKGLAQYAAGATANVIPWSGPERRMPPRRTAAQRRAEIAQE
jgi:hypothetical protein